jgi:aspartate/methionine/tyrosine aminotransferase
MTMTFDQNRYLSWYMPRVRANDGAINLHASGVPALTAAELATGRGDVDTWTASSRFEAALAAWLGIDERQVLFTPGGTGGTLLALLTLSQPGSHAVVELPIYEPMFRQAERLCQVDRLIRRPETGWRLPLLDAEKLIGPETRLVLITEPHNPSGRFAPSQDVLELADMARRQGAVLLINEVYRGYSDRPSYHGVADNIVVVSSLSKLMGAYSARLGWLSGPEAIVDRLRQGHVNMSMSSSPNAEAGLAVLARADELRAHAVEVSRAALQRVDEWVERTPGLFWHPPQGPGFGCVSLPEGSDDVALAERLHAERRVLVVPGSLFDAPGTLRVSWIQAGDRLDEGLELIADEFAATIV